MSSFYSVPPYRIFGESKRNQKVRTCVWTFACCACLLQHNTCYKGIGFFNVVVTYNIIGCGSKPTQIHTKPKLFKVNLMVILDELFWNYYVFWGLQCSQLILENQSAYIVEFLRKIIIIYNSICWATLALQV